MTTTALISGARPLSDAVGAALRQAGVDVLLSEDAGGISAVLGGVEAGGLDVYVQLPVTLSSEGSTVVARVRQFLREGMLARFEAVEAVLPALARDARVVIVAGTTALDGGELPDDRRARFALLEVLAHALRADRSGEQVRVHTLSSGRGADEIAAVALGQSAPASPALADIASRESEMSYEDWRTEVLGLATVEV